MVRDGDSYSGSQFWWLWKDRWDAWQASRAALRVELPQGPDLRAHGEFRRGHAVAVTEVTEALQQAGIEVK
nr:hypothetical protein [Pseudomonas nitroreducens]